MKLPNVSGYLVIGLLLGPSFLNFVSTSDTQSLEIISELALAFIAFSIGSEFVLKDMSRYGKSIFIIALAEVAGAIAIVFSLMYFIFNMDFAFSIVIASMSAATAPAATLMVIRQYRAYGPLTKTILPVVALDDAFGIMAFGIAISLAKVSVSGERLTISTLLLDPIFEIIGSMLLGLAIGVVLSIVLKRLRSHEDFQITSLIAIGIGLGAANALGLSSLLTNMMLGATLVNLLPKPKKAFNAINDFVAAFYVLFFTLAGASLDLGILKSVGVIGIAYVIARFSGKYLGAYLSSVALKSDKAITKYLGLALLPQGGVSIGLSVLVRQQLPQYATAITTIIMFSVLIYETTGPIFAKIAIQQAGEVHGLDKLHLEKKFEVETEIVEESVSPSPTSEEKLNEEHDKVEVEEASTGHVQEDYTAEDNVRSETKDSSSDLAKEEQNLGKNTQIETEDLDSDYIHEDQTYEKNAVMTSDNIKSSNIQEESEE